MVECNRRHSPWQLVPVFQNTMDIGLRRQQNLLPERRSNV